MTCVWVFGVFWFFKELKEVNEQKCRISAHKNEALKRVQDLWVKRQTWWTSAYNRYFCTSPVLQCELYIVQGAPKHVQWHQGGKQPGRESKPVYVEIRWTIGIYLSVLNCSLILFQKTPSGWELVSSPVISSDLAPGWLILLKSKRCLWGKKQTWGKKKNVSTVTLRNLFKRNLFLVWPSSVSTFGFHCAYKISGGCISNTSSVEPLEM